MDKHDLQAAINELRSARAKIDRSIEQLEEILHTPTAHELRLQLAELEGWDEMEKYMSGRA